MRNLSHKYSFPFPLFLPYFLYLNILRRYMLHDGLGGFPRPGGYPKNSRVSQSASFHRHFYLTSPIDVIRSKLSMHVICPLWLVTSCCCLSVVAVASGVSLSISSYGVLLHDRDFSRPLCFSLAMDLSRNAIIIRLQERYSIKNPMWLWR